MKQLCLGSLLILGGSIAFAAVTPEGKTPRGRIHGHDMDRTVKALHMTHDPGMEELLKQGHWAYRNLIDLAFDEKRPMQLRWRALTRMAKIGQKNSIPELERAAKSQEWFMRSASLVAFRRVNRDKAIEWARELLADPAMVVRAEAVTTLGRMLAKDSKNLLWEELYARKNFRNGKSLWLRRQIVEVYVKLSDTADVPRLIKVLGDHDESLYAPAIGGLERLTKQTFGGGKSDVSEKTRSWQLWYAKNKDSLRF